MSESSKPSETVKGSGGSAAVKQMFKRGLAALLPTLLTLVIIFKAFQFLRDKVGRWISDILKEFWEWAFGYTVGEGTWQANLLTVVGILIAVLAVFLLGYFLSTVVGRWLYGLLDGWLSRLPVVRRLYPSLKQVTNFLLTDRAPRFTQVVAVPYPRRGVYSLGFVTGEGLRQLDRATGRRMINVFVPTSPTPVSGYVVFFPEDEVIYLEISVEEALKFVVSGGVVVPGSSGGVPVPGEWLGPAAGASPGEAAGVGDSPAE